MQIYSEDELEDVACTLDFANKLQDHRAVNTCLEILCPAYKNKASQEHQRVNDNILLSKILDQSTLT